MRGRDLAGAVAEAQQRIAKNVKLPTGYRIEWAGEFEWLQQAKKRLAIIVPITLVLIMVLLYGLFNSLRDTPAGAARHSVRDRAAAFSALYVSGLEFQHLGRDRIHFAVRRVGDERHPDHQRLLPGRRRAA